MPESSTPPSSEEEWAARVDMIEAALRRPSTWQQFYDAYNGRWEQTRRREHDALLDRLWAQRNRDARTDSNAVIAGGMAGAGKKRILSSPSVINAADYCIIDPDDVKVEMAEQGMIPSIDGLSPMEASSLVHEEASYLAKLLATFAYEQNMNVVWDITMKAPESVADRISTMAEHGYPGADGIFVDVPFDVGRQRAIDRYREDQETYWNGEGPGGRYVPRAFIEKSRPEAATESTRNHEVFLQVRDQFDSTVEYDNSATTATVRNTTGPRWM